MSEEETKSEAPQLREIATQILNGLLASGDFTEVKITGSGYNYPDQIAKAKPEAVQTAIDLALELIATTNG
jgi:hypothetical protein